MSVEVLFISFLLFVLHWGTGWLADTMVGWLAYFDCSLCVCFRCRCVVSFFSNVFRLVCSCNVWQEEDEARNKEAAQKLATCRDDRRRTLRMVRADAFRLLFCLFATISGPLHPYISSTHLLKYDVLKPKYVEIFAITPYALPPPNLPTPLNQ